MIKFTDNGYQIHPPLFDEPVEDNPHDNFAGRVPILYDENSRAIYMGGPNWFHSDVYANHGLESYTMKDGYIGTGQGDSQWGSGLGWYGTPPMEHNEINQALTQHGYIQPNAQPAAPKPTWKDVDEEDLWED